MRIPVERRLQTLAVMFYCSMFMLLPVASILLALFLLFTPLFFLSLGYFAWIFYDTQIKHTSARGGRRWGAYRRSKLWQYFRDYFPIELIKTAEVDPSKNYIFGYHPHGVLSCGAIGNFGTEATGFSQMFPGITPYLCTLKENFRLPLVRGPIMWTGADVINGATSAVMSLPKSLQVGVTRAGRASSSWRRRREAATQWCWSWVELKSRSRRDPVLTT